MAIGRPVELFDIKEVSEGCNYSDDISALTSKQSPDSMNVEFFNGRIRKRLGETAFTTSPTGQGGIDTSTKLLLPMDGVDASTTFTDISLTPHTVTAVNSAQLSTSKKVFGTASGFFNKGIDTNTVLMLHCDGADNGTVFTDSSSGAKTVTRVNSPVTKTAAKKFGTASAFFGSHSNYLTLADSSDWNFGSGLFTIDFWINDTDPNIANPGVGYAPCGIFEQATDSNNLFTSIIRYDTGATAVPRSLQVVLRVAGVYVVSISSPSTSFDGTWHHVSIIRGWGGDADSWVVCIDGVAGVPQTYSGTFPDFTGTLTIGTNIVATGFDQLLNYLDEFRVTKGIARWTAAFVVPAYAYATPSYLSIPDSVDFNFGTGAWAIDCWLYTNGNVGSTAADGIYTNRDDGNSPAIIMYTFSNLVHVDYTSWSLSGTIPLTLGVFNHVALTFDGVTKRLFINGVLDVSVVDATTLPNSGLPIIIGSYDPTGGARAWSGFIDEFRISKGAARWTTNFTPPPLPYDTFNSSVTQVGFSVADYSDSNSHHKQIAHIGIGVYAYDQISNTKIDLRTSAPFVRSYNANIGGFFIQTYNDYSAPYYWDGIAATMSVLSANAPGFKHSVEFQGYLLGFNTSATKMRCYYQLVGNIIGGGAAYSDFFTLSPAPNDDEVTSTFVLNGRLYAGTKYGIFRISFVGGVTIFEFKQVVSNVGVVPETAQVVVTKYFGQVVLFLGADKRLYLFDGVNVKSVSDLFYYHNKDTDIAMDLIDDNYKENAFAIFDTTRKIYRLFVTKKASSQNYYCLNVDIESFAYYPFDNMKFSSGTVGYDNLLRPFVICADYTGALHKMFCVLNTDNGTAINEHYTSPLVSVSTEVVKKGQVINIQATPSSSANFQIYDRVDFRRPWTLRQTLPIASSRDKFLGQSFVLGSAVLGSEKDAIYPQISASISFNAYQFKLLSDTPMAPAWEIIDITVAQSSLKYGKAEAQR